MAIETAMIAAARPHIVLARSEAAVLREAVKGCEPLIYSQPVALEPAFCPITRPTHRLSDETQPNWVAEKLPSENLLVRKQIWIAKDQPFDWRRSERWLKLLAPVVRHRVAFEVVGNGERIAVGILCHQVDAPLIESAFTAQMEFCELAPAEESPLLANSSATWDQVLFCDFLPEPPYSHLFTSPEELASSPLEALMRILGKLPKPTIGVYQVVFQPVAPEHPWAMNVCALLDYEHRIKSLEGSADVRRYAQQQPSSPLQQISLDLESKAHNDKPFFAAALRMAVLNGGERAEESMRAIAMMAGLFQHGRRPLCVLTEADYRKVQSPALVRRMFADGATFRPGFLLNSWELTSMVHVPPPKSGRRAHLIPWDQLETLPPDPVLRQGTPLGSCKYAGSWLPVCVPFKARIKHAHFIGRSGSGKTSVMERMILDDVARGEGVAVIDPHGDLMQRLLALLPLSELERIVYIDPGDPEWTALWNPLNSARNYDPGGAADDLVCVFKTFVEGWGDRLEHILRNTLYGVLTLPGTTLLDVATLLRTNSDDGDAFRKAVLDVVDNKSSRDFWEHDFKKYGKDDFGPPRNKLSKLLLTGGVSQMLSQPASAFDLRQIMDEGKILLFDLSRIGMQVRDILGCLLLALLSLETNRRSHLPRAERRTYHIYCDEAHRFMTDAMEDVITQARKYNVSLTLAHQYLSQFSHTKTDALCNVGATIMFSVGRQDALQLSRDLRGLVDADDLINLDEWQAVARIGNQIVRFKTDKPPDDPQPLDSSREAILQYCRQHYYRRSADVRREIAQRYGFWGNLGPSVNGVPHHAQPELDTL
jgi:hypothetical protein